MDLNADLGEMTGDAFHAVDEALLRLVTTAHVACGGHTGDDASMHRVVAAAAAAGVVVGAHPSYPDREGFGRLPMDVPPAAVADQVVAQVNALRAVACDEGVAVRSVKPHGALYHRMATDEVCAGVVAGALRDVGDLAVVLPAGALTFGAVAAAGLRTVAEGFCDRAYRADGSLVPRTERHALVTDPAAAGRRAVSLAVHGVVEAVDGTAVPIVCETLCVHGDTPGAVPLASAVRETLELHGVRVRAFAA